MDSKKDAFIGIRIDKGMKKDLEKLASKSDRSLANYIRYILRKVIGKGGNVE